MPYEDLLKDALVGLGAGVSYALTGFGKSSGEKLDYKRLAISVLTGAIAGVVSGLTKLEMSVVVQYLTNAGVVVLVENVVKTIWRRFLKK